MSNAVARVRRLLSRRGKDTPIAASRNHRHVTCPEISNGRAQLAPRPLQALARRLPDQPIGFLFSARRQTSRQTDNIATIRLIRDVSSQHNRHQLALQSIITAEDTADKQNRSTTNRRDGCV